MMSAAARVDNALEARFVAAIKELRPRLHRFCTRMTGSVMDGEDVVQETLVQAFRALPSLSDPERLEPWLFRIAHNKCVDFLRRARRQSEETLADDEPLADESSSEPIDEAMATLVTGLPPMERATVLLKDVLDYRLSEIAEIVHSTVGGVKSALHRGRTKLRASAPPRAPVELAQEEQRLLKSYVDLFNRRDWDALRRLIQADARIEIVGETETPPSTYFTNYSRLPWEWRFGLARADGEPLVILWRRIGDNWRPHTAVRLWWQDGKVVRIRDYVHIDYLLKHSRITRLRYV